MKLGLGFVVAGMMVAMSGAAYAQGQLKVGFGGGGWDGRTVPAGQQCRLFGGKGATPPLRVSGIPKGANAIIVEFNDLSYGPLKRDGGHGKIRFPHKGGASASLPSVPGHSRSLPGGASVEAASRATGEYASPGYLPPCSGGRGNTYEAQVKAVTLDPNGRNHKVLAVGRIVLGKY